MKTIVTPVDGSSSAIKAVRFAADYAMNHDCRILLLHVLLHGKIPKGLREWAQVEHLVQSTPPGAPEGPAYGRLGTLNFEPRETIPYEALTALGEAVLQDAEETARNNGAANVERVLEDGDNAGCIIELARREEADMIIMGSRGLSDLKGLLLGSVSHKVSSLAPCTCVVVR